VMYLNAGLLLGMMHWYAIRQRGQVQLSSLKVE